MITFAFKTYHRMYGERYKSFEGGFSGKETHQ